MIDQRYLTSWNNRQAPDYNVGFSDIFRSQMLDERIKPDIKGNKTINLQQLIGDMEDAGTVDLRGDRVLPWLLKVIRTKPITQPALLNAVQVLTKWEQSGAHRIDRNGDGVYDSSEAIRIMDAWWPRLVQAQFEPRLGKELYGDVAGELAEDSDRTDHLGSAFDTSAYGFVQKDLRDLMGDEGARAVLARLLRRRQARQVPRRAAGLARTTRFSTPATRSSIPTGPASWAWTSARRAPRSARTRSTTAPSGRSASRGCRGSTGPPSSRRSTSSKGAAERRDPAISVFTFGGGGTFI